MQTAPVLFSLKAGGSYFGILNSLPLYAVKLPTLLAILPQKVTSNLLPRSDYVIILSFERVTVPDKTITESLILAITWQTWTSTD